MELNANAFGRNARKALLDKTLQEALGRTTGRFQAHRDAAALAAAQELPAADSIAEAKAIEFAEKNARLACQYMRGLVNQIYSPNA